MKTVQKYLRNVIEFGIVGGFLIIFCHYLLLFSLYDKGYSMTFLSFLLMLPFFFIPLLYFIGKLYLKDYLEKWDSTEVKYLKIFFVLFGSLLGSSLIIDLAITMMNIDFIVDLGKGYDTLLASEEESVPQEQDSLKGFPLSIILFIQFIISYICVSLMLTLSIRKKMSEDI